MRPKGKMGIPAAREALIAISAELMLGSDAIGYAAGKAILALLPHLTRNKPEHTKAHRVIHKPTTYRKAVAIWALHRAGFLEHEIALKVHLGPGRVSEVLHGLVYPEARNE